MAKRKEPVRRPAKPDEWTLKAATTDAAHGWEDLCHQAPGNTAELYDRLTLDPRAVSNPARQGRLKGSLSTVTVGGATFDQWQYEVTAGGRVWYAADDTIRIVWITSARTGHPKATE